MKKTLSITLLLTLMLTVFLDIGNFFMPMPVYTPLFLHSSFLGNVSHATAATMLGILVAFYGAAQFFGGPFFGEMADQKGRKKTLTISLLMAMLGCLLGGISMSIHSIGLIYISRIMIGFASGTVSVVFAVIADCSDDSNRGKNIGYVSAGAALGAIMGPLIGGYLATMHHIQWMGYATPFYFMTLLYGLNILLMLKLLTADQAQRSGIKINLLTTFRNIGIVFKRSALLRRLVLLVLFFQIGCESFYLAAPIFAVKKFHLSSASIGNYFLLQGLVAAIVTLFINKHLCNHFKSRHIFLVSSFLFTVSLIFLLFGQSTLSFAIPFIGIGIFGTLCWVHSNNLFSESVDQSEQGLIFGVSQSLWSAGGFIGALTVGLISAVHFQLSGIMPIIFEALAFMMIILVIHESSTMEKQA